MNRLLRPPLFVGAVLLAGLLGSTTSLTAAEAALPGGPLDEFSLRDSRGKLWTLAELHDRKLVVLVFLGVDCPLVKQYAGPLEALARELEPRGVAVLGVNANQHDAPTEITAFADQHKLTFPILKDLDAGLADRLGAERTPEAFVLDDQRRVRYRGRIDDQFGIRLKTGYAKRQADQQELRQAIEDLLAGREVAAPVTAAPGCLISRPPRVAPHGPVNYAEHVAAILNQRCVNCHRPGQVGPFPLTTHAEAAPWAGMIREVVEEERMPPWFADPAHGKFANDARLTDRERQALMTWAENGAPEGDPSRTPAPPQFAEGWQIPEPDAVYYTSDTPVDIPATGVVDYKYFTVDPGFTEDKWIKAAEAKPGNPAVVHHHSAYFEPPGTPPGPSTGQVQRQIAGYAPGTPPFTFPPGYAIRVPAGSKIVFQMHYTPNGTPQQDRSYLGVVFADPEPQPREVRGEIVGNLALKIPPGDADYRLTAERKFRRDLWIMNLAPHMHLRGKSFRFELERPDGQREILLDVPRYDFNWQLRYDLAEPLLVAKGSRLRCYARWDNSADNPHNPDPSAEVKFGEQSWEEMMFGVFQVVEAAPKSADSAGGAGGR